MLFPPIEPYATGRLPVDCLHELYWEESGRRDGKPILFLHGGPGAGAASIHRRFFDPRAYRIVIFDQRGAGRSTPLGETRENTTPHLIGDIERLRELLEIDRWHVFGGSWGSTLALAYAQAFPARVSGLILRGIFLSRRKEIEWFLYGMRQFFPEAWEAFAGQLPEEERGDLLKGYLKRLLHDDPAVHRPAARAWSVYEGSCSTLLSSPDTVAAFGRDNTAIGLARLEAHYFANDGFLEEEALLRGVGRIRRIPGMIIQGRYDNVCPPASAWELAQAWPEAGFEMIAEAGHSALEPAVCRALIQVTEAFKQL